MMGRKVDDEGMEEPVRHDPLTRFKKYWRAKAIADRRGVKAKISTGRDQADRLMFFAEDGSALFSLLKRERGSFIHLPHVSYFSIPSTNDLDQCAVEIASLAAACDTAEARVELITTRMGGVAISSDTWHRGEQSEQLAQWNSVGWKRMTDEENATARRELEGTIGLEAEGMIPTPRVRWNIAVAFEESEADFERLEADLTAKILMDFRKSVPPGELYSVIDYNHFCYWFDPHQGVESGYRDYWAKPVFPLGDSYFYLARQNSMGLIALFPSYDVIAFGEPLVGIILDDPPILLSAIGNG